MADDMRNVVEAIQLLAEVAARLLGGTSDVAVTVAEPNVEGMGAPE
jgi:hypothetical protein